MSIFVVRDVEDLIIGWLGFLDHRRLAMVSRYYRARMNREFRKLCTCGCVLGQLDCFLEAKCLEACQWLLARKTISSAYELSYQTVIQVGDLALLQWAIQQHEEEQLLLEVHSSNALKDDLNYLLVALGQDQIELIEWTYQWKPCSADRLLLLQAYFRDCSRVGLEWLDQFFQRIGRPLVWTNHHFMREQMLRLKSIPAFEWMEQKMSINWREHRASSNEVEYLFEAPPAMQVFLLLERKVNYSLQVNALFIQLFEQPKRHSLLPLLLQAGYVPFLDRTLLKRIAQSTTVLEHLRMIAHYCPFSPAQLRLLRLTATERFPLFSAEVYLWLTTMS